MKALLFSGAAAARGPAHATSTPVSTIVRTGFAPWRKPVLATAFAYFVVATIAVAYTRLPFVDEGVFVASSIHIVQTGLTGDPSVPPWGLGIPLPQSQVHNFWVLPGFLYSLAAWFQLFPATLYSARALSILFGIIALVLIYRFVRTISRSTALSVLTLVLLATDFNLIVRVATARMDSLSLALNFGSWLAYIHLRRTSLPLAAGVGCALGSFSLLVHPNGIFAFVGLAILGFAMDSRRLGWRSALAAIVASAAPMALLLPLYLRAPEVWQTQMRNHSQGRFISFLHPLNALNLEFQNRYLGQFGGTDPFQFSPKTLLLLVLAAYSCAVVFTIVTFRRRQRLELISLGIFGITAVYFAFFEAGHYYPYNIHLLPCLCVLLAGALLATPPVHRRLAIAAGGLVMFINMAATAAYVHEDRYHKNYMPVVQRVTSEMGPNDLLLSYSYFGIPLGFHRVTEDYTLVDVLRRHPKFVTLNQHHFLLMGRVKTWVNGPDPVEAGMILPGEKAAATAYFLSHYTAILKNRDFTLYRRVSK